MENQIKLDFSQSETFLQSVIKSNKKQENFRDHIIVILEGDPGNAKTACVESAALKEGCRFVQYVPAQDTPEWAGGIPVVTEQNGVTQAVNCRPNWFREPVDEWTVYLLDEVHLLSMMHSGILQQLVYEGRIGNHHLPERSIVVLAANGQRHRAGANPMPTPLRLRLTWIYMQASLDTVIDYQIQNGFKPVIPAFLKRFPEYLNIFEKNANSNPNPRSWKKLNTILSMELPKEVMFAATQGTIGEAYLDFIAFQKQWERMPDPVEALRYPKKCRIPYDQDVMFSMSAALGYIVDPESFNNMITYIKRWGEDSGIASEWEVFAVRAYKQKEGRKWEMQSDRYSDIKEWFENRGIALIN